MFRCAPVAVLLGLVGCASGGRADGDDQTGGDVPGVDGPAAPDAARVDAAPPIPPVDAPGAVDAFVPDAFVADACVPMAVERLANPGFDSGPGGGWVETPIVYNNTPIPIVQTVPSGATFTAHSGNYIAWLGGLASFDDFFEFRTLTDVIEQSVAIPAGATGFVIGGQYLVQTGEESDAGVIDTFKLELVAASGAIVDTVLTANNTTAPTAGTWTAFSKPIAANLAGQSFRLRATSTNDFTASTSFFLDSLTLTATQPCP